MNQRLKKIIFEKLNCDLSDAEIIVDKHKSIWIINRTNKYWYLQFQKSGKLWWRQGFFKDFFQLFSLESSEFQPIIAEWMEGFLNCKVVATYICKSDAIYLVEDILKRKVVLTTSSPLSLPGTVEDTLKRKVVLTNLLEKVLEYKDLN
jgi:hypothetical protein